MKNRSPACGPMPHSVRPLSTQRRLKAPAPRPRHWSGLFCVAITLATAAAAVLLATAAAAVLLATTAAAVEILADCPDNSSLCIQSSELGLLDLRTGTAVMEGQVRGHIQERKLRFSAESLKAFRDKNKDWTRLVLERNVQLHQPNTEASASHMVLTRERALLLGNSRAERPPYLIEGHEIELDDATQRIIAKGSPENPARVRYQSFTADDVEQETRSADGQAGGKLEIVLVEALRAVVDSARNEILLTGQVVIERPEENFRMVASTAYLKFDSGRRLEHFRGEGGVKIVQLDRILRSDIALSQNNNETILLIGNASVEQAGQFQVSSDRLEVYTDATKGVVQGQDKERPIKLAIDITPEKEKKGVYLLSDSRLRALAGKGVPFETLAKLEPLKGRGFSRREKFEAALRRVLSGTEASEYMEAILAHAR